MAYPVLGTSLLHSFVSPLLEGGVKSHDLAPPFNKPIVIKFKESYSQSVGINKNLSSSFTGSSSRGMSEFDKEVESRMNKKRLDMFTDEFSPPGAKEAMPGVDYSKRNAPYEKPHDDFVPEAEDKFWNKKALHSAGDVRDQEKMDWLDQIEDQMQKPIKNPFDQFPGDVDMNDHKEGAALDIHQTDAARLGKMSGYSKDYKGYKIAISQEGRKTWDFRIEKAGRKVATGTGSDEAHAFAIAKQQIEQGDVMMSAEKEKFDGPDSFHKEVERRMNKRLAIEKQYKDQPVPSWDKGQDPEDVKPKDENPKHLASPSPEGVRAMAAKLIAEARRRGTSVSSLLNSSEFSSYRPHKNEILGAVQASVDHVYGENNGKGQG